MSVRIVADRNIAAVEEAFALLGEVRALPASELTREAVRDADLVLTRSTVKVGPQLLDGSRARFVATATIGVDHLDQRYLAERGIAWASAPGSNADSVVQWMAATLRRLQAVTGRDPARLRIGVVGVGQVGGRVARLADGLAAASGGAPPLLCDPPRALRGEPGLVTLDELLPACDLVTLHVPLERDGPDATERLFDDARLRALKPGALLVNACRGEVVDGAALARALDDGHLGAAALDVFEREPEPDAQLIARCAVATPHIAGHSVDGKLNGTRMVYQAACRFLGVTPTWQPRLEALATRTVETSGRGDAELLLELLACGYSILDDDAALRAACAQPPGARGPAFRLRREQYPARREIHSTPIELVPDRPEVRARALATRTPR